jgi:hypothetical protein
MSMKINPGHIIVKLLKVKREKSIQKRTNPSLTRGKVVTVEFSETTQAKNKEVE